MVHKHFHTTNSLRVLHLEDSDLDASLVKERLDRSSLNISIDRVIDRSGFIDRLQRHSYDVILSDYQLPTWDGLAALDFARQQQLETPFIFVSGAMGEELAVETLKRGATDYVLKDRLVRLELAIDRALRESRERAERLRAEKTVLETLALLEGITEGTEELIAAIDRDFNFTVVNRAYEREFHRVFGTAACVGKSLLDSLAHLPDDQAHAKALWLRALAGESFSITADFGDQLRQRRTFDLRFYPIVDETGRVVGAGEIASDVTDRTAEVRRQQFLGNLALATQPLTAADAITARTAQLLAEHLVVDRCAYAEIEDETIFDIIGDYSRGVSSIVGRWQVASFGEQCAAKMQANQPFVVSDIEADVTLGDDILAVYRRASIRAVICVPLFKEGRFRSAMAVHQNTPRKWTPKEIELVQIVVGRSWEAIERARALRQLQTSEERFRTLVMTTSSVIWRTDAAGAVIAENPSWQSFTGQTVDEYVGQGWINAVHPEDRDRTTRLWSEAIRDKTPYLTEYRLRRHDGEFRYVIARGAPVLDSQGHAREWIGNCADVTDRKKQEAELAQSEQRYRLVADAANDAIWDWEMATQEVSWNEGVRTNFGYSIDEIQTHSGWWTDRIHPEDVQRVMADIHRHLELGPDSWQAEYRFRRADGSYAYVIDRGRVLRNAKGQALRMVGSMLDLTERRQAEHDLARLLTEEKRHAALLNRVAIASRSVNSILSAESIARIVAEQACTILSATSGMTSWLTTADCQQHVLAASSSPSDLDSALTAQICNQNRPMRVSAAQSQPPGCARLAVPLAAHGGKNLGAIQLARSDGNNFSSEDEMVLLQLAAVASAGIENARLYEQVREQDRRKDEFLATLAHELRNPLAPIRTGLSVLKLASPDQKLPTEILDVMGRQIEHMVRLIDDLLDVSRITRGMIELKCEQMDIRQIFAAAIEVSRSRIEAFGHRLVVNAPDDPLLINADATRMAQVVSNLLNNAAKYTPSGGTIELSATRTDDCVAIQVKDNGTGIAPEMLSKVFEMFTQVGQTIERSQGGLGIGLALVSSLVAKHGGTVKAHSDGLGKGCVFSVYLPYVKQQSPTNVHLPIPRNTESLGDSSVTFKPRRILVVDDNTDGARVLAQLLQAEGHLTALAHTGLAALSVAREFRPDVVLLDIGLPEMNGYEVAQHLRAADPSQRITLVALTGWGTEEDRRRSRDAGFDHHFTKPVDAIDLQSLIASL